MDEETPEEAKAAQAARVAQLNVMWSVWEDLYLIGYTDEHGWWASRRGRIGHLLTADGPGELGQRLCEDFGLRC